MTHLLCLGDSITDCGRLFSNPPLGNGYVTMLSEKLAASGKNFHITNCGVDGFTVNRLLENAPGYLSQNPDIVTLLIGINDIGLMLNTHRTQVQQSEMMEAFFLHYRKLLTILTSSQRKIILMEPFIFPFPACYQNWFPFVKTMSDGIRKLADEFQLPYLHLHDCLNEEARRYGHSSITTDGIHLTAAGHEILAEKLFHIL